MKLLEKKTINRILHLILLYLFKSNDSCISDAKYNTIVKTAISIEIINSRKFVYIRLTSKCNKLKNVQYNKNSLNSWKLLIYLMNKIEFFTLSFKEQLLEKYFFNLFITIISVSTNIRVPI